MSAVPTIMNEDSAILFKSNHGLPIKCKHADVTFKIAD